MATITTPNTPTGWSPDEIVFLPEKALPGALMLQTSIFGGTVEGDAPMVRALWVKDTDADFVDEGEDIDEDEPELAESLVSTGKISKLVKVSREQWEQERTGDSIANAVGRAMISRANQAYLNQTPPTPPKATPAAGILQHPELLNGGTIDGSLDALTDILTEIEENDGQASHILASPRAWGRLRKFRTAVDHNTTLLGAGTTDAQRMLLDLPVIITPALEPGKIVALDSTAIVSVWGSVKVAASEHYYFNSDSIALRSTWRVGQTLVHPERVALLTVADPTPGDPEESSSEGDESSSSS